MGGALLDGAKFTKRSSIAIAMTKRWIEPSR